MKKLIDQIMKFGVVGIICFIIDWAIGVVIVKLGVAAAGDSSFAFFSQIGAVVGFTVSVIVNYILSFKFVFERKEDLNKKAEFVIFIILSVIGLGINSLIVWLCTVPLYNSVVWFHQFGYGLLYTAAKVLATAIVMVYNFITRKIFLEKKN